MLSILTRGQLAVTCHTCCQWEVNESQRDPRVLRIKEDKSGGLDPHATFIASPELGCGQSTCSETLTQNMNTMEYLSPFLSTTFLSFTKPLLFHTRTLSLLPFS